MYKVAGYVKLAKLWEKKREQAIAYHKQYYEKKYEGLDAYELCGVYIDITGQREICKRPQMLRLIRACQCGHVNCIATQSKAYLAANAKEFCYLIKLLFSLEKRIEIVTEDMNYYMDTIRDADMQHSDLKKMADDYVSLNADDYLTWKKRVLEAVARLEA